MIKVGHYIELISGRQGLVTKSFPTINGIRYEIEICKGLPDYPEVGYNIKVYGDFIYQSYTLLDQYILNGIIHAI